MIGSRTLELRRQQRSVTKRNQKPYHHQLKSRNEYIPSEMCKLNVIFSHWFWPSKTTSIYIWLCIYRSLFAQSRDWLALTQRERQSWKWCIETQPLTAEVRRDGLQNLKGISGEKTHDAKKKNIPKYCFVLFLYWWEEQLELNVLNLIPAVISTERKDPNRGETSDVVLTDRLKQQTGDLPFNCWEQQPISKETSEFCLWLLHTYAGELKGSEI